MTTSFEKLRPTLIRNLSAVSLHKVVQVAGLIATVALVPRLFGAEDYGRFAFVLSLSYLGQVLGDFGTLDVMGRFTPGLAHGEASRLYMRHLAFKGVVGAVCGLISAIAALALSEWMRPDWAILTGLSVGLHIVAWVPFQFSLGLNRVGIWMSEQVWRQWVLLLLLLALLPPLGLSGALLALVVMELIFCVVGLWAARDYWHSSELRFEWPYLRPYLRFGLGFFLANLAAVALYRSGPLLVETLTGEATQTGYFNLAIGLFLLAYVTTGQFAQSLIPNLSDFYNRGQVEQMGHWLNNFVRAGWLLAWLGVITVWAVADWATPLVFGADFAPAAAALKWISLGMPLAVLLWAANVTATVTGKGTLKFAASLAALAIFGVMALILIPLRGAAGASLALGAAVLANVVVLVLFLRPEFKLKWGLLLVIVSISIVCLVGVIWLEKWGAYGI
jgi:O-antigen/teichoic acid export membrane protein